jgi:Zn-dependent peptidase ImmA (M78 family)
MRRGFKTEARALAQEVRAELKLRALDPLNPWALAENLAIPVWRLSDYQATIPGAVERLTGADAGAFSAMMAFVGQHRVIIHNDSHAITRQRADIAHELAHALLLHEPHRVLDGKTPDFNELQEAEASWLGASLLVTDKACLLLCRRGVSTTAAADRMGVSEPLMRWRINSIAARKRIARGQRAA